MSASWTLFHLDGERGLRGGERQLLYLAAHARRRGHDNVIVCRAGEALDREAERQGFARLQLPFCGEFDLYSAWRLRRAAAGRRAVLHAHTAHGAALGRLAALWGGPPLVVHRRVDFPLRGAFSRSWKYDGADRVVAVSESIRRLLVAGGMAEGRVAVIPDCLPQGAEEARAAAQSAPLSAAAAGERRALRAALAAAHALPAQAPWIGNLAAWVPHKDQATLLRAWPFVLAEHPQARLLLVGGGELAGELKALARELGVASSVLFAGRQDNPADWMRALDVYVQSSWGEGMGSVLLEAMACRVPICATRAGGIPEVVDETCARLVPPRDPEALGAVIAAALSDPRDAERRAAAAAQRLRGFSLTALGDRTLELYREVLG